MEAVFATEIWPDANVDSLDLWRRPGGGSLLFITAKEGDVLKVIDGETGQFVRDVGQEGEFAGEFDRPNGVAVVDNYVFVVERDNKRAQVLSLPGLEPVAMFGEADLIKPYNLALYRSPRGYEVYITDDYYVNVADPLYLEKLAKRVKHYRISSGNVELINIFGGTETESALTVVETIAADPKYDRLLISDEDNEHVKVYTLDGKFTGQIIGAEIIQNDPEGIVILEDENAPEDGYIIISDQGDDLTMMRVFRRQSGLFIGTLVDQGNLANSDGIALESGTFGPFSHAALYAVHDDVQVLAYSLGPAIEQLEEAVDARRVAPEIADVTLTPVLTTAEFPDAGPDSMATYITESGQALLYVVAKDLSHIKIFDAATGEHLRDLSAPGEELGYVSRPNGLEIWNDLLFVVERDNFRVQVWQLPTEEPLMTFGEGELALPYGIAIHDRGDGSADVFITDDYLVVQTTDDWTEKLTKRVKQFRYRDGAVDLVRSFGSTTNIGALAGVEVLTVDPMLRRLLICDEENENVKIYTLDGVFTGQIMGGEVIQNDPEGVVIINLPDHPGGGYVLVADQGETQTFLRAFDRSSGEYAGTLIAEDFAETDSLALHQGPLGEFAQGLVYATHDERMIKGFAVADIVAALEKNRIASAGH